jgi:hypothetical protein
LEGVPPVTVQLLLDHGYLAVVLTAAEAGEWFCAKGAVKELVRVVDQFSASLGVWVWRQRRERSPRPGKTADTLGQSPPIPRIEIVASIM